MFDISVLKEMKLTELQDIAKLSKTIKFNGVKKEALIAMIIENQVASEAKETKKVTPETTSDEKSKRARITAEKKPAISKSATLFSEPEPIALSEEIVAETIEEATPIENKPHIKGAPKVFKF